MHNLENNPMLKHIITKTDLDETTNLLRYKRTNQCTSHIDTANIQKINDKTRLCTSYINTAKIQKINDKTRHYDQLKPQISSSSNGSRSG